LVYFEWQNYGFLFANRLKSIVIDGWIFRQSLSTKIGPEVYKNSNGFSIAPMMLLFELLLLR